MLKVVVGGAGRTGSSGIPCRSSRQRRVLVVIVGGEPKRGNDEHQGTHKMMANKKARVRGQGAHGAHQENSSELRQTSVACRR